MKIVDDDLILSVCEDCIMLIVNGQIPVDSTPERDAVLLEKTKGMVSVFGEENETEFSWQPCDACRSPLGGSRFGAMLSPQHQ